MCDIAASLKVSLPNIRILSIAWSHSCKSMIVGAEVIFLFEQRRFCSWNRGHFALLAVVILLSMQKRFFSQSTFKWIFQLNVIRFLNWDYIFPISEKRERRFLSLCGGAHNLLLDWFIITLFCKRFQMKKTQENSYHRILSNGAKRCSWGHS